MAACALTSGIVGCTATMTSLLERKLIVVTGKGGTGKTTVASALGLLGARSGLRTIVAELGSQNRLPALFERSDVDGPGVELELEQNLWSTSIDPDAALIEWLRALGGRISVRMLAASSTFQYFAAAAPGAKELVSMVKVRELCERPVADRSESTYDLVVLDAQATGHALAMLRSPQTFAAIVRAGPLAEQAHGVRELLEDQRRSAYVAVAHGTEMAVTETLELEQALRSQLERDLDAVVVNATVPRRFTREELERISPIGGAAARAATTVHHRAQAQQGQIARLRRQRTAEGMAPCVVTVPFAFTPGLDLAGVGKIASVLARKLQL
jgi:anion-transporting  ArsA/GET3 family ATPase